MPTQVLFLGAGPEEGICLISKITVSYVNREEAIERNGCKDTKTSVILSKSVGKNQCAYVMRFA